MSEINLIKSPIQNGVGTPRASTAERPSSAQSSSTNQGASNNAEDKVSLTDAATQLQSLQQNIAALSEVDSARVAELRSAIENGEYLVDAQKLAQNVIKFEGQF